MRGGEIGREEGKEGGKGEEVPWWRGGGKAHAPGQRLRPMEGGEGGREGRYERCRDEIRVEMGKIEVEERGGGRDGGREGPGEEPTLSASCCRMRAWRRALPSCDWAATACLRMLYSFIWGGREGGKEGGKEKE